MCADLVIRCPEVTRWKVADPTVHGGMKRAFTAALGALVHRSCCAVTFSFCSKFQVSR